MQVAVGFREHGIHSEAVTGNVCVVAHQALTSWILLSGDSREHRQALLVEEEQPFGLPGLPGPVRMRTVITAEGRLTRYFGTDMAELYDHREDPHELQNLAGSAEHADLENRLTLVMLEEMAALSDNGTAPTAAA